MSKSISFHLLDAISEELCEPWKAGANMRSYLGNVRCLHALSQDQKESQN